MKTPEAFTRDPVRKYLKAIGCYRFTPVQMGIGQTTVDDLCCIKGRFVGIEYKREGAQPTVRQAFSLAEIKKAGGIAIWGDSAEMVIEQLKAALGLP